MNDFTQNQIIDIHDSIITVKGKVLWNDGRRRIDIKKPIRSIFEPLETETQTTSYIMEQCLSKENLAKRTQQLLSQEIIPILFYFIKEPKGGLKCQTAQNAEANN